MPKGRGFQREDPVKSALKIAKFFRWQMALMLLVSLCALSGCGAFSAPATATPIFVTATPAPTDPLVITATVADTSVFGPTAVVSITWTPLPTATKTPRPTDAPTLTPSFTPEFTETLTPKPKPGTGTAVSLAVGLPCSAAAITAMPPNGFTALYQRDRTLQAALGCPQSAPVAIGSAVESFESGTLIWASALADQPHKVIYALYASGSYQRFDDTWTDGIDPASTGEYPPAARKAPIRGFGKVWHTNPTVHAGLGWATTDEGGTSGQIQRFERGELLFVASTNQTYIFSGGVWRADPTKF